MLSSKYPISLHVSCLNECKAQNFGEVVLSLNRYQQLSTLLGRPNFQRIMYFYLILRKDNQFSTKEHGFAQIRINN